jgi:hypothetical protein
LERIFDVCLLGACGAQTPLEFLEVDIVGCTRPGNVHLVLFHRRLSQLDPERLAYVTIR